MAKFMEWITPDCTEFKICVLTVVHGGNVEHRGPNTTWKYIQEPFIWSDVRDDVRSFVVTCLLFVLSKSRYKVPPTICNED